MYCKIVTVATKFCFVLHYQDITSLTSKSILKRQFITNSTGDRRSRPPGSSHKKVAVLFRLAAPFKNSDGVTIVLSLLACRCYFFSEEIFVNLPLCVLLSPTFRMCQAAFFEFLACFPRCCCSVYVSQFRIL